MNEKIIERHLNNNFINGECMSFYKSYLSKYDNIIDYIDWAYGSYMKIINGIEIKYDYEDDINVSVKTNNHFKGTLSITISKYHNSMVIIDNLKPYYSNNNDTTIVKLNAYKDGNSYIGFNKYRNYNKRNEMQLSSSYLIFDNNGVMTDYKEVKGSINNKQNDKTKQKKKNYR